MWKEITAREYVQLYRKHKCKPIKETEDAIVCDHDRKGKGFLKIENLRGYPRYFSHT